MGQTVPGTEGYADVIQKFIAATLAIDFEVLHREFLPYIPNQPGNVLDIGAGIGRDAAVFSRMGHAVVAAEPADELRLAGMSLYPDDRIHWLNEALPSLPLQDSPYKQFDFILISGVWHHLSAEEQIFSLQRLAQLLQPAGTVAISLRHGPAGAGTHIFPVDDEQIIEKATGLGLKLVLRREHLPSLMKNKEQVTWTKLLFQKEP